MNLHIPDVRILEVHPCPIPHSETASSSCSGERKELGVPLLLRAVKDAAALGYNYLSVAGEEPMEYPSLAAICREAHNHGMLTSMVTRKARLSAAQLDWLRFSIDLLGVEVAGREQATRRIRRTHLGQTLEDRLGRIRDSGIPFAVVFPLNEGSLPELEWAAEFAAAQGAAMLQVRPSSRLSDPHMATAWMMIECMSELQRGKLVIHFDAVNRYGLPIEPSDLESWLRDLQREARYLGEVVSPLVIEDDGGISPVRHGFPRHFALGNLHEQRLAAAVETWVEGRAAEFCDLYSKVLRQTRAADRMFGDLYEMLAKAAADVRLGWSAAGC